MGMNLNGPIYLQRKGFLTSERNKILDIGPQNVLFVREEQLREFIQRQGGATVSEATVEAELKRLVYFSTPRPGERTTLFSEITDLTNIEYNSVDVCPGLKTTILDLNFDPVPSEMLSHYHVIFNFGTTEHILNQWNCFEFMHDALEVGGVIYHQLPASGYLDHGYYCYTPLFFREMAQANDYVIEQMAVTPAGESKIDSLNIPSMGGDSLLSESAPLGQNNRVPALNIHAVLRKTSDAPFRASLEIATAHSEVATAMLERYKGGARGASFSKLRLNELLAAERELVALKRSRSWQVTQPLRDAADLVRRARGK
ncbi:MULTISPECIES: hypothetical protein [unclassified Bradyrhizobium]|uniref:hypothetical protein n=1 Tax=unclassified Bradyrhizobium TaxID=2631580 RepID=UPI0028E9B0BA|nr:MULTISPECIES: hypothetical protein [unclassified Bradyrhizobium]